MSFKILPLPKLKILGKDKSKKQRRYISPSLRKSIYDRDGYKCVLCENNNIELFNIDHAVPYGVNGPTEINNLQILCYECHKQKGARVWFGPTLSDEFYKHYNNDEEGNKYLKQNKFTRKWFYNHNDN